MKYKTFKIRTSQFILFFLNRFFFFSLAQTAKVLVACVMLLSFALVYYVPVDVVWRRVQDRVPAKSHRLAIAGLRLAGTLLVGKIKQYNILLFAFPFYKNFLLY